MIKIDSITNAVLHVTPYKWAEIANLYSEQDASDLAETFPHDHYKTVSGYGGEKNYDYEARALKQMGSNHVVFADDLSEAWQRLATELGSSAYRTALSQLTGIDLSSAPMEVNVFHYGPGASLGPHPDLRDKVVTHILYFNSTWDVTNGGCLNILHDNDASAVTKIISPIVGNSAVLVRSDNSWHSVSPVVQTCRISRRSVTVTFYQPDSLSSMWPPGDETPLHRYPTDT